MRELTIGVSARTPRMVTLRLAVPEARFRLPEPRSFALEAAGRTLRTGQAKRAVLALDDLLPDTEYVLHLDGALPYTFRTPLCAGLVDLTELRRPRGCRRQCRRLRRGRCGRPAGRHALRARRAAGSPRRSSCAAT